MNRRKTVILTKKAAFLLVIFLALVVVVNAYDLADVHSYYSFDDDDLSGVVVYDLSEHQRNGTNNGAHTGLSGILEESFNFTGEINHYVEGNGSWTGAGEKTVSFWFKPNIEWSDIGTAPNDVLFLFDTGGVTIRDHLYFYKSGTRLLEAKTSNTIFTVYQSDTAPSWFRKGEWTHIVLMTSEGNNWGAVFINGTLVKNVTVAGTVGEASTFTIGSRYQHESNFNGTLDEFAIFNATLTTDDITTLFNGGNGLNIFFGGSSYTVKVYDAYNDELLEGVNVTFYNSTNILYSEITVDAYIRYNSTKNPAFIYYNATKDGYFNDTSNAVLANNSNESYLYQSVYNVTNVTAIATSTNITRPYNCTVGGKTYDNCSNIYLLLGSNNITWAKTGEWYDYIFSQTSVLFAISTFNISNVYNNTFNVSAYNTSSTLITDQLNFTVYNATLGFYANCTTTVGTCLFNLSQDVLYNVSVNASNYADEETTIYISSSSQAYNFTLGTDRTFQIVFKDEITLEVINETLEVELISDLSASNYTVVTGYINFSLLTASEYTIRYRGVNYPERDYIEVVNDNTYFNITLYGITYNDSKDLIVTVKDTGADPIEGAIIKLLRYYVGTNTYQVVEMARTDYSGKAWLSAEPYEGHYKMAVDYNGINYFLSSSPTNYIPDPTYDNYVQAITINLDSDFYESYRMLTGLGDSLVYNETTHGLSYTWSDPSGIVNRACLFVERVNGASFVAYTTTCSVGSTGSVVTTLNSTSSTTYKYRAYIETSTTYSDHTRAAGWIRPDALYDFGAFGAFMGGFIIVGLALMFSFSAIAVLLIAVFGTVVLSVIGLLPFQMSFILGLGTLVIGLSVWLFRRN